MQPIDLFATKGVESLFAGAFLLALAGFWKLVNPRPVLAPAVRRLLPWFQLRDDAFFHQGHTWVVPAGHGEALVGMDDFAQKLLGKPGGFLFPVVGAHVKEGEPGWQVQVDGHTIPMLSPVDGEVVAVNQDVVRAPELVNTEPYDRGWLMRIKVPSPAAASAQPCKRPIATVSAPSGDRSAAAARNRARSSSSSGVGFLRMTDSLSRLGAAVHRRGDAVASGG